MHPRHFRGVAMSLSGRVRLAVVVVGAAAPAFAGWLDLQSAVAALLGGAIALPVAWFLFQSAIPMAATPVESRVPPVDVAPARGLVHELNNVLTVVMGNADLLLKNDGADTRQCAKAIYAATERGARLTHELLVAARRQTPDLPVESTSPRGVA